MLLLAVGVMAGAAALVGAPAASAAGSGLEIIDVKTTPTTVAVGDQLETDMVFTVPDGTPAGRTTQLTLPKALVALPAGFDVRTSDGTLVATAVISPGDPAVITFTTTDYAQTHMDVHGTAFVRDNFDSTIAPPGQTTQLRYVTDATTFTNPLTVLPGSSIDRTGAYKFGQFVRSDQGSQNPTAAIYWFVESPVAPAGGWTSTEFKDVIPAGESIDCATVTVSVGDGTGPGHGFANGSGFGDYRFSPPCSTASLDLLTGPVPAGKIIRVQFTATLDMPTGGTQTTFVNAATVITKAVYGGPTTYPASGTLVQSSAGGIAVGVTPVPPTTTTVTTSTTSTTETTPSTVTTSTTETTPSTSTVLTPTTTVVVLPTSSTQSSGTRSSGTRSSGTQSSVTTVPTTPIPVSPSPSSPISTTSDGTTIQVLPTSHSLAPTTSNTSNTSAGSVTSSTVVPTTTTAVASLASTGAPVQRVATFGALLVLLGSGLLTLTLRRRGRHHDPRHS